MRRARHRVERRDRVPLLPVRPPLGRRPRALRLLIPSPSPAALAAAPCLPHQPLAMETVNISPIPAHFLLRSRLEQALMVTGALIPIVPLALAAGVMAWQTGTFSPMLVTFVLLGLLF